MLGFGSRMLWLKKEQLVNNYQGIDFKNSRKRQQTLLDMLANLGRPR